jgi:hypothetical protein
MADPLREGVVKALLDIVTGLDGKTHDIGRWFGVLAGLTGIGLVIYDVVVNHNHFDCQAFGIGMAALAGGVGAFLKLKADTEPKP